MARRVTFKGRPAGIGAAKPQTTMWRCGIQHSTDGAVFADDAFTEAEWARLEADPHIAIEEADAEAVAVRSEAAISTEELEALVVAAIGDLAPDAFGSDGKPKLHPLRAALPDHAKAIDGALRDAAWEVAKPMVEPGDETVAGVAGDDTIATGATVNGGGETLP